MAGYRKYILVIILLALLAAAFFALPDSINPPANDTFVKCSACHPRQVDELKRAFFHTSKQCTDCHSLSGFREDLRSHRAATLSCSECHDRLPRMADRKPLDHTSFNVVYEGKQ